MTQDSPFIYLRRVEFADTDLAGIAHFSRIFCYMEEAEHAFLRSLGLSVHHEVGGRIVSWPRLSTRCDFRNPVRFEQTVAIGVQVAQMKRKTVTYRFSAAVDELSVASGEFVVVCCEVENGAIRAIEIPAEIRSKFPVASQSE